ncbi:MAG: hypothetical protein IPI48_18775 [bacterium]|nr:hypothetical protein [bacterium]
MNLLVNAGQAIRLGEITIRTWADDERIHVRISDTGQGVAPENLSGWLIRSSPPNGSAGHGSRVVGSSLESSSMVVGSVSRASWARVRRSLCRCRGRE